MCVCECVCVCVVCVCMYVCVCVCVCVLLLLLFWGFFFFGGVGVVCLGGGGLYGGVCLVFVVLGFKSERGRKERTQKLCLLEL